MTDTAEPRAAGPRKYVVAKVADIPEGGRVIVEAGGREIGIYRVEGKFYGMLNRCPHLGGPLCQGGVVTEIYAPVPGDVRGNQDRVFVTCPWHNWEFDIRTGQSYWNPKGLRARPFPVGVEQGDAVARAIEAGGAERVRGPYAAEMVPVAIEDEYLVLNLRPGPPRPAETAPVAPTPVAMEGSVR
jgi:3-phenylpropionate/trans-cinnamate dioxygenase ferredoxin subunit